MSSPVAFVNVIDVDPSKQQEVIALLTEGIEQVISKRPGFISASVLANVDGSRVVNVAHWQSSDDIKATQADPAAAEFVRRIAAVATARPGVYTVVSRLDV